MADSSWPAPDYNSGSVNDREYELLASRWYANGLSGLPADTAVIYADGTGTRTVKVRAGKTGLVRGFHWYSGDTDWSMPSLAANTSGISRIDRIVLQLDRSTYHLRIVAKTGTPGAGAPALSTDTGATGTYEIPVGQVTVASGAATFTGSEIALDGWYLLGGNFLAAATGVQIPNIAGLVKYEPDPPALWLQDGTAVHRMWCDTGWVDCPGLGGSPIQPIGNRPPRVRRIGDVVYLRGGTCGNSATVYPGGPNTPGPILFVVPDGFRPADYRYINAHGSSNVPCMLEVGPGGPVSFRVSGGPVNTGGNFLISDNSWPVG